MLAPFRQKKGEKSIEFNIEGEPFLIIDNCRYGTKLSSNFNARCKFRIKVRKVAAEIAPKLLMKI